jgi:hypothetical protein
MLGPCRSSGPPVAGTRPATLRLRSDLKRSEIAPNWPHGEGRRAGCGHDREIDQSAYCGWPSSSGLLGWSYDVISATGGRRQQIPVNLTCAWEACLQRPFRLCAEMMPELIIAALAPTGPRLRGTPRRGPAGRGGGLERCATLAGFGSIEWWPMSAQIMTNTSHRKSLPCHHELSS